MKCFRELQNTESNHYRLHSFSQTNVKAKLQKVLSAVLTCNSVPIHIDTEHCRKKWTKYSTSNSIINTVLLKAMVYRNSAFCFTTLYSYIITTISVTGSFYQYAQKSLIFSFNHEQCV
jgi:hypothetical protein